MADSVTGPNPNNPIDPATAGLIRTKSRQVVRQAGLSVSDREDIEQTLALHMLVRLEEFDEAKENRPAFVRMVLRQATVNVLRFLRAGKRAGGVTSLDARLRTEGGREVRPKAHDDRRNGEEQSDLARDVARVLESLPEELRRIAEELKAHSIAQAARNLRIPRSTLYERAGEIRAAFEAARLRDYL